MKINYLLSGVFVLCCTIGHVHSESLDKGIVDINATASEKVPNDLMKATLFIEDTKKDATAMAKAITEALNASYAIAKSYDHVKIETKQQQTYPIYDNNQKITGWHTRAEIELTTTDFKQGSQLVAQLQNEFKVANIQFLTSPEVTTRLENQLLTTSIQAFKERAEIVKKAWGANSYQLVKIDFQNSLYQPPFIGMARSSVIADSMSKQAMPAQDYQAGDSNIKITANGTIQLIFK